MANLKSIESSIAKSYLSLNKPDYSFAIKAFNEKIYEKLVCDLQSEFKLDDQTDINNDVCFTYHILKGINNWLIQISMVGPYATLMRLDREGNISTLASELNSTKDENDIIAILKNHSVFLLEKKKLTTKIDLKSFDRDDSHCTLYEALFCDLDIEHLT